MTFEVKEKTYTYTTEDGRTKTIRRSWKVNSEKVSRAKELDDYFENNQDRIRGMKNIRAICSDYNNCHENKVSYNIVYKKYVSIYDTKKAAKQKANGPNRSMSETNENAANMDENGPNRSMSAANKEQTNDSSH